MVAHTMCCIKCGDTALEQQRYQYYKSNDQFLCEKCKNKCDKCHLFFRITELEKVSYTLNGIGGLYNICLNCLSEVRCTIDARESDVTEQRIKRIF